ncbi:Glutamyl-tRNA(Gln) amidotransferase subunit A [Jannaschia seosinensis]|uniref:Glutamyl-tRNA(Gln) amidotransferase subunit A n=1 Tax=Jannaschia seosinensis TaxID=313367 RepID=A0A0M7B8M1_9RHOB|nr:amidase [Jannaschia seosinensis]CUH39127.1 Glutamyl-tRNA(Gln) amidotransferase subunit A [Jannaschia seosinensis]
MTSIPEAPGAKGPPRPELLDLSAVELRDRLATGAIRAVEIARALAARIAAREPEIGAWAHFDAEHAMRQAQMLDRLRGTGRAVGPLHAIPVGIKDIFDTADMPTANGTPLDAGRRPERDALAVAFLRGAGALVAGKTETTELAFLHPARTSNPHDTGRTPGGSSAGSAAAVAAGMVPLAMGTQTGGSVLRPASYVGVVGYKPSFGLIPLRGALVQSPSLDTVGTFARDVAGAALLADVLAGHDPDGDRPPMAAPRLLDAARSAPPVPPTFALVRPPWWELASFEMRAGLEELAAALGEQCFEAFLPDSFADAPAHREVVNMAEMAKYLYPYDRRGFDALSDTLRSALDRGKQVTARDYLAARDWMGIYRAGLETIFARCDAILMPAAPGVAPDSLKSTGDGIFNALASFTGSPAISLPLLQADGPSGPLPMGVQVMGRLGDDARLLRTAAWLERWTSEGEA